MAGQNGFDSGFDGRWRAPEGPDCGDQIHDENEYWGHVRPLAENAGAVRGGIAELQQYECRGDLEGLEGIGGRTD